MIKYTAEVTIDRPVAKVFEFATDIHKMQQWTPMGDARITSGDRLGVGTVVESSFSEGPLKGDFPYEITEWEVNRKMAIKTRPGAVVDWEGSLEFEAIGPSATRMRASGQIGLKGLLKVTEPLMAGEVQKGEQAELEQLKGILEGTV